MGAVAPLMLIRSKKLSDTTKLYVDHEAQPITNVLLVLDCW